MRSVDIWKEKIKCQMAHFKLDGGRREKRKFKLNLFKVQTHS